MIIYTNTNSCIFSLCFHPAAFIVLNLKNFRGGLWLGLIRPEHSPEFLWIDHSITLYTNWATSQPDAPDNQTTCVVANNSISFAGGWSDVDCSDRYGFVCRIRRGRVCGIHVLKASLMMTRLCLSEWKKAYNITSGYFLIRRTVQETYFFC